MPKNMNEVINTVIVLLAIASIVLLMVRIYGRIIKNKHAPVKTVKAVVIDKHTIEAFSKYAGNGKQVKYVVVFSANGKKLSFYVSEFSYRGYRVNESGILKYKGDRIIDFGR